MVLERCFVCLGRATLDKDMMKCPGCGRFYHYLCAEKVKYCKLCGVRLMEDGCNPTVCYYCGMEKDTRKVYVQTNPQERECCQDCWDKMKAVMTLQPMVGGGVISSDWEDDE